MLSPHSLAADENSIAGALVEQIQARYVLHAGREFCFYTLDDVLVALEALKERDPSVLLVPDVSCFDTHTHTHTHTNTQTKLCNTVLSSLSNFACLLAYWY